MTFLLTMVGDIDDMGVEEIKVEIFKQKEVKVHWILQHWFVPVATISARYQCQAPYAEGLQVCIINLLL